MPGVTDFDFLHGSWDVHNRRLVKRLTNCTEWEEFASTMTCRRLFDGAANIDEFWFPTRGSFGMTIRIHIPATRKWSIWWVSSTDGVLQPPVTGSFYRGELLAYGDDTHEGTPIRVRYHWSGITATSARWDQAFSVDGGSTWEVNWTMELIRRPD